MHRSGTSALTGMLQRLGVQGPRTALPADEHNPLGYGESMKLVSFHDRLLQSADSRWDAWGHLSPDWFDTPNAVHFEDECRSLLNQEFPDAPLFVVKDPRLCRLVPFWLRVLQAENIGATAVSPIRSPSEVARSLETRNHLATEQSLLMWLRHVLDAELATRKIARSFVRYRDLLSDWKLVANRVADDLRITWPDESPAAHTAIRNFLRSELCHHSAEIEAMNVVSSLSEWLKRTYSAVELLARLEKEGTAMALEALDEVRYEFDRAASIFGPIVEASRLAVSDLEQHASSLARQASALEQHVSNLEQHISKLEHHVSKLEQDISNLEQHNAVVSHELAAARHLLQAVLRSASWRITAPLRAVAGVFVRDLARKRKQ